MLEFLLFPVECVSKDLLHPQLSRLTGAGPTPDSAAAAITPAPRARLARQADAMSSTTDGDDDYELCEPFTLKQGASTWEIHMTDPLPGAWTVDMNCKWQGAITNADLTCVATADGFAITDKALRGTTTTTLSKDELSTMELIGAVAVVTSSGAASASASQTTSGAKSGAPAASASKSSSGAAGAAPSTGFAPAGPLPTGAMALVGGAAGVFVAALAL
jgi:hypothetical protein